MHYIMIMKLKSKVNAIMANISDITQKRRLLCVVNMIMDWKQVNGNFMIRMAMSLLFKLTKKAN